MIDKSKKYVRLFRVQGLRFLIDDIWMGYYRKLAALTVFIDGYYTSYLPREVVDKCLENGIILYGNKENFEKYSEEFNDFKERVAQLCQQIGDNELSKEMLAKAFKIFSDFFHYYSKTEFFYTDNAFSKVKDNAVLENNLRFLGDIKNSGRELLNNIFFGNNGYLNLILGRLSNQFNVSINDLQHYSINEILKLFDGEKVSPQIIAKRDKAFIIVGDGQDIEVLYGDDAKKIIEDFLGKSEAVSEVRGTSANKGIIKGRAKVIVSGYDNYDKLNRIISKMNHGEILISETTSPELTLACQKAGAIVTDQGGMLSHAAIISRELNIPCVVGTENATKMFQDGDLIEVDADNGIVRKLD